MNIFNYICLDALNAYLIFKQISIAFWNYKYWFVIKMTPPFTGITHLQPQVGDQQRANVSPGAKSVKGVAEGRKRKKIVQQTLHPETN